MFTMITGATAGIGKAVAQLFAQKKYNLIITGRRGGRLNELAGELRSYGVDVIPLAFDVSSRKEVEQVFERNRKLFESTSILINNAGLACGVDPVDSANLDDWETMIDTNVKGLLYMTRMVLPSMKTRKSGHIVNIGSVAGRWTYRGGAVYCATKFAVRALSEGVRMDTLGSNIRVTNIEPGMVETEFSIVRLKDEEKAKKVYEGMKPLTAHDIAETILWSVERPSHVNIQELVIYPTDQAHVGMIHRQ